MWTGVPVSTLLASDVWFIFCRVSCARICFGCVAVLLLLMCSICIALTGGSDTILSACVDLMGVGLPTATVGSVPTVFCRLGCRFGASYVVSIGVLNALYTCMFVEV
jgi:hypothetical protein